MSNKYKSLKMPLWQDIVYMCLVGVAPIVITAIELFQSHSTIFKWTFASVGALLITIIVIKKYVIRKYIDKCRQEVALLEHDYSIGVGDETACYAKWKHCKMILYIYDAVVVLLSLVLAYIFITALADGLIAFKGAITFILMFVLAGMIFKIFTYVTLSIDTDSSDTKESTDGES